MQRPFILAIYGKPTACEIYRIITPFYFLRKNGGVNCMHYSAKEWERITQQGGAIMPDILVYPRGDTDKLNELNMALYGGDLLRGFKSKLVYETDDDLTNRGRVVARHDTLKVASMADLITVTTPYLARVMKETGKPVAVLPNCVDLSLLSDQVDAPRDDDVAIALTGSPTHYQDWLQVAEPLKKISKLDGVRILVAGFIPDYLKGMDNTTYIEWGMPYVKYLKMIWRADITLCPLDPADEFNKSKSPIKAIEGMALARRYGHKIGGSVAIATDTDVYREAITDRETGMLVQPGDWYDALEELVRSRGLRTRLGVAGYNWVRRHRDYATQWKLWKDAYWSILSTEDTDRPHRRRRSKRR